MQPPETIVTEETRVSCDGGGGPLGHPRVWYTLSNKERHVDCLYCGRRFVLKEGASAAAAH